MKTLVVDIETSPNVADVWGLWNQNVSLAQLRKTSFMLCWAAKWVGDTKKDTQFFSTQDMDMVERIHSLLDEADAVVHYNGNSFDIPVLNREMMALEMAPPSPYRNIDLYRVVKKKFRFASNKLEHVVSELGLGRKLPHQGHRLWVGVMNDDSASWEKMKRYNIEDVHITEKLYNRILPWVDDHPNHQLYSDDNHCPRCGSLKLSCQGYAYTKLGKFQRYQCKGCGGWSRSSRRVSGVTEQVEL